MYLSSHRLTHGEQKRLAQALRLSARTLRTWRHREGRTETLGRPPHSADSRRAARELVERAWDALPRGHDGWRSVALLLERQGICVSIRLVQESLRDLKRSAAERRRARIEERRVHVDVHTRDALWALDQTHLLRDCRGALNALVVRECLVPHTLGVSIGPPARAEDVRRLIERVARERGRWPLVLQMDNGPENKNAVVNSLLEQRRVIALWNEPRTPEHNGRIERSIESLKCASGLGLTGSARRRPGERVMPRRGTARRSICERLFDAWASLDARTPRAGLDGLTPLELDKIAPRAEDRVRREAFYADVRGELRRVAIAPINPRARRKQEREAIWNALQRYGLVQRTRDGCFLPTLKEEVIL